MVRELLHFLCGACRVCIFAQFALFVLKHPSSFFVYYERNERWTNTSAYLKVGLSSLLPCILSTSLKLHTRRISTPFASLNLHLHCQRWSKEKLLCFRGIHNTRKILSVVNNPYRQCGGNLPLSLFIIAVIHLCTSVWWHVVTFKNNKNIHFLPLIKIPITCFSSWHDYTMPKKHFTNVYG